MSIKSRAISLVLIVIAIGIVLVVLRHTGPSGGLRAAFNAEFLTRPDGYPGLTAHYGFKFPLAPLQMESGLMYRAVADGIVDVICGFSTDGRIPAYDLVILEDDKRFFPPYYAAPLIRADTLREHPELEGILNRLAGEVSGETMQRLNYAVDEEGRRPFNVAREFLISEKLIPPDAEAGDGSSGRVVIGGKEFTEQEILGQIIAILIECRSNIKVVRKLNLGGTMICFNALKAGDLDLYCEYTGTGLVNILKRNVISDPEESYEGVRREFQEKWELVWLKPFGFNNTYTLTMRQARARKLGIQTISDLATFIRKLGER
jgi:osmoprotectant transport system permease protein